MVFGEYSGVEASVVVGSELWGLSLSLASRLILQNSSLKTNVQLKTNNQLTTQNYVTSRNLQNRRSLNTPGLH